MICVDRRSVAPGPASDLRTSEVSGLWVGKGRGHGRRATGSRRKFEAGSWVRGVDSISLTRSQQGARPPKT